MNELSTQGIDNYELWPSVYLPSVVESINRAHKQIVEFAMLSQWKWVAIAEDDIKFTHPNGWNYFLSKIPEDFDIYLGGIYLGDIREDNSLDNFHGLHLYVVAQRYYETFLAVPGKEHIDRAQAGLGRFVVCNPFAAIQYEGYSNNTGKDEKYDQLLRGRELYTG
jgi:hypothetical protein